MILFRSLGHKHLNGYKELSKHAPLLTLQASEGEEVYFPTMSPNGKPITFSVKEGDKVKIGTKIGSRTDFEVPLYSSVSGTVIASKNIYSPQVGRSIPHLVIQSDGKNEEEKPLKTVTLDDSKETIFEAIKQAGIVGMGGAGFPLYVKYNNVPGLNTLIVNGVECEPFLTTDFVVMQEKVHDLILGCKYLMKVSGVSEAIIAIKVHKDEVKNVILSVLADEKANIRLQEVPDVYPMGWEKVLIKQISKKEYEHLPSEAGIVVNNAQSVISIGQVLSTGKVVATRTITVSGNAIKNPSNVICPIGTLATKLIEACGGLSKENATLIPGGPMCGNSVTTSDFPMLMQMGSLTILEPVILKEEPCLRCGSCTAHCPAGLQPVEIRNAYIAKDIDRAIKLNVLSCIECGLCSYSCPSRIELTQCMKNTKRLAKFKLAQAQEKK
ncbi:MAG: RnfABCDGE type electron transport complex subunit C [Bacilli bacterium]